MSPAGGSSRNSMRRNDSAGVRWWRRLSSNVPIRSRSERSSSVSTSATDRRSPFGEALGLGEQHAVLPDHRLAVPGQVGGRLALPRGGVDVGGQAPRRRRAGQQAAVLGAADRDRAAGQVGQHRRARQRRLRAGRNRHEHVLADLDVQHEAGQVGRGEQQVGAERRLDVADADDAALVVAGRDLAALVELPVGRQVRLGHHAEHHAAVDDHGGVVDAVPVAQRRADHQHRQQVGGGRDDVAQRRPRRRRATTSCSRMSSME